MVNNVPNKLSSLILTGASVAALISAVLFGGLSDFIGRKKPVLLVGVCMAVLLPVCYLGMAKTTDTTAITCYAQAIAFLGKLFILRQALARHGKTRVALQLRSTPAKLIAPWLAPRDGNACGSLRTTRSLRYSSLASSEWA